MFEHLIHLTNLQTASRQKQLNPRRFACSSLLSGSSFIEIDIICEIQRTANIMLCRESIKWRECVKFIDADSTNNSRFIACNNAESSLIHIFKISFWVLCVNNSIFSREHFVWDLLSTSHHHSNCKYKWNITLMCSWFVCTLF